MKQLKLPDQLRNALLLAVGIVVLFVGIQQTTKWSRQVYLADTPNQACRGISEAIRQGFKLAEPDIKATSIVYGPRASYGQLARYNCNVERVITASETFADGSSSQSGYDAGASVTYFRNENAAYEYAEKIVNPSRYWSVDQAGVLQNIPQTSLFTYIVTDVPEPYFLSYTVRDNRLFLLNLPCGFTQDAIADNTITECQAAAEKILKAFADKSTPLYF